ncbi:hypothetical protein ANN_24300 [Periplaneta americana]|uniref:HTH CENPB-type domain-containing protein n=1 Tax=Periplaneta americana TaxID=6978 RepID=A0ABQ8S316_PERAM|nr:hypothetical protein ANN_24300 [Periplaneta americana]
MIQEKALEIAKELNVRNFVASNGWLECFRKRYNIAFRSVSGEGGDIATNVIEDGKNRLPSILAEYELRDIHNVDETGFSSGPSPTKLKADFASWIMWRHAGLFWSRQGVARASSEKEGAGKQNLVLRKELQRGTERGEENYGDDAERTEQGKHLEAYFSRKVRSKGEYQWERKLLIEKRSIFCGPVEKELNKRLVKCLVPCMGQKYGHYDKVKRNDWRLLKCGYGDEWSV